MLGISSSFKPQPLQPKPTVKYAINSLKHHLIMNLNSYLNPSLIANISYRFLKRIDDDSYNIMDLSLIYNLSKCKFI